MVQFWSTQPMSPRFSSHSASAGFGSSPSLFHDWIGAGGINQSAPQQGGLASLFSQPLGGGTQQQGLTSLFSALTSQPIGAEIAGAAVSPNGANFIQSSREIQRRLLGLGAPTLEQINRRIQEAQGQYSAAAVDSPEARQADALLIQLETRRDQLQSLTEITQIFPGQDPTSQRTRDLLFALSQEPSGSANYDAIRKTLNRVATSNPAQARAIFDYIFNSEAQSVDALVTSLPSLQTQLKADSPSAKALPYRIKAVQEIQQVYTLAKQLDNIFPGTDTNSINVKETFRQLFTKEPSKVSVEQRTALERMIQMEKATHPEIVPQIEQAVALYFQVGEHWLTRANNTDLAESFRPAKSPGIPGLGELSAMPGLGGIPGLSSSGSITDILGLSSGTPASTNLSGLSGTSGGMFGPGTTPAASGTSTGNSEGGDFSALLGLTGIPGLGGGASPASNKANIPGLTDLSKIPGLSSLFGMVTP